MEMQILVLMFFALFGVALFLIIQFNVKNQEDDADWYNEHISANNNGNDYIDEERVGGQFALLGTALGGQAKFNSLPTTTTSINKGYSPSANGGSSSGVGAQSHGIEDLSGL